jgi:hypothetical protein
MYLTLFAKISCRDKKSRKMGKATGKEKIELNAS